MKRYLAAFLALCFVGTMAQGARAQGINYYALQPGTVKGDNTQFRLFAFSYLGNLNDNQMIHRQTQRVMRELDRTNQSHYWKYGNGNFYDINLEQGNVFVIGWKNLATGQYGFLATVPGSNQKVDNRGQVITNSGWYRHNFRAIPESGSLVFLQLGCHRGKIQWCIGWDDNPQ